MGYFSNTTTTVVRLDDENTVTLQKLTYGQMKEVISASLTGDPREGTMTMDMGRFQMERLVRGIASWSGPGFEGKDPSRANILALPEWIGAKLDVAMDALPDEVTEEEGNASETPTGG